MSRFMWRLFKWLAGTLWPLPPDAIMCVGDQHRPRVHRSQSDTLEIVTVWSMSGSAPVWLGHGRWIRRPRFSRDHFCAVGLTRGRCVHLCSVWTPFIKRVVCHTYSPSQSKQFRVCDGLVGEVEDILEKQKREAYEISEANMIQCIAHKIMWQ